jgi:chromosome segregation ATPase
MSMNNSQYKSATGNKIAGGYAAQTVTQDRENKILSGTTEYAPSATLGGMIKDLNDLNGYMGKIGVNNGWMATVYRVTDALKLTSPQARLNALSSKLQTSSSRLDRLIRAHWDGLEQLSEETKDTKTLKRDANYIMDKYSLMQKAFDTEESKLSEEKGKLKEEMEKIATDDAKRYTVADSVSQCNDEIEKMKDDKQTVGYKLDRAASAVIKFDQRIKYFDHQRQVRKCAITALERVKNNLDVKISEIDVISKNNGNSLMGTFQGLRQAQQMYEEVCRALGDIPDVINRTLTSLSSDINFETQDTSRVEERTKDLKRAEDRTMSEVQRRAEEIRRKDLAA